MNNRGWLMSGFGIKYNALLLAGAPPAAGTCNPTTLQCARYTVGFAIFNGPLGFSLKYYDKPPGYGADVQIRYGCAEQGDTLLGHEATHQASAVPEVASNAGTNNHTNSNVTNDLMSAVVNYTFSSNLLTWNGAPGYQATVSGSSYVQSGALSGSSYKTCS